MFNFFKKRKGLKENRKALIKIGKKKNRKKHMKDIIHIFTDQEDYYTKLVEEDPEVYDDLLSYGMDEGYYTEEFEDVVEECDDYEGYYDDKYEKNWSKVSKSKSYHRDEEIEDD